MLKKTLAAAGIAGILLFGAAGAAMADDYPPTAPISAGTPIVAPGEPTVITATGLGARTAVTFSITSGSGATLASLVVAAGAPGASVVKPVTDGTASATFTATAPGEYTVSVLDGTTVLGTTSITVSGSDSGSGSGTGADSGGSASGASGLPPTGGSIPGAVIWAGVGAIGLGGIAVAAVAARRRTQSI